MFWKEADFVENDIFVDSVYVPKGKAPRQILTHMWGKKQIGTKIPFFSQESLIASESEINEKSSGRSRLT